jgi:hypothetical protein
VSTGVLGLLALRLVSAWWVLLGLVLLVAATVTVLDGALLRLRLRLRALQKTREKADGQGKTHSA